MTARSAAWRGLPTKCILLQTQSMQVDDGSLLLRRQLAECHDAAQRHAEAVDALNKAAAEEPTENPPRSGWLVAAGRKPAVEGAVDPNPPRLWFDLTEFGADNTGTDDCSAALSMALHAASRAGGGATILVPSGRYRIACPVMDQRPNRLETHRIAAGAPLSCAVHLVGEGLQHSELLWEAVGWQLLAVDGGGSRAIDRWQRAEVDCSSFPLALASHGLALVQLSIYGVVPSVGHFEAQQQAVAARHCRRDSFNLHNRAAESCSATNQRERLPTRYDVRLQRAQVVGFDPDQFDLSAAVIAAAVTVDAETKPCQLVHAKQRDHSMPQNLKRGCAACDHAARSHSARMLLQVYERWLQGAAAVTAGELHRAAAEFCAAGRAAAAAGELVEAGLLWSNHAECLIRLGEYDGATVALQKALYYWPEHGDSQRRLKFVAEAQGQNIPATDCSCCELDLKFFGFERTGAKALSHLAGDLHGAAAELEAALAFGSPRAVWCHADRRTPREMRMGSHSALNVAVPNGVAGDTNELTVFQEIDLMCENRQLWCEVKAWTSLATDHEDSGSERIHSSSNGATRWAGLLAQLRRYRDAAQSYTVAHALLKQPEVVALIQGPPGASDAAVAALRAEGFGCLNLHHDAHGASYSRGAAGSQVSAADVLTDLRQRSVQQEQPVSSPCSDHGTTTHCYGAETVAGTKRRDSGRCLQWEGLIDQSDIVAQSPEAMMTDAPSGSTCGESPSSTANVATTIVSCTDKLERQAVNKTTLVLDQGMLALLVANIWDLTVDDMRESGAKFLRLFSGETVFETPEGLLAILRPLYRLLTSSMVALVACESSVTSFEHFLALRGDDVEHKRWDDLRQSDRLQILTDIPLPSVLKPIVVDKCHGAVALGLFLDGALTLIDDILTVRRLRFHPDVRLSMLLTPEGKLRASYLGLGVKGRPATLQCVGVCGQLRHSSDFSYNARRAASQVQLVWTADSPKPQSESPGAPSAAQTIQGGGSDTVNVGRVICYGCSAAEDAVSLVVSRVFRIPAIWADLVHKARVRWSVETRPWCQRRWILGRLLQSGQRERQLLLSSIGSNHRYVPDNEATDHANDDPVHTDEIWSKAREAVLLELCGVTASTDELLSNGSSSSDAVSAYSGISRAQNQTNLRNAELFEQMSSWLQDGAVLPRAIPGPCRDASSEQEDDTEDFGLSLGGTMIGQEDY